jgi:CRP-like cAMP-binding protein
MQFNQGADAKMGGSKITIADIPFFNHLDAGDIMAISQHLQALSFAAEDMLFYQGDPPNGLFLVTSGSVKTYVYAPGTTKKVVVKLVKAGDYLGEFGLLDGMPRSASAMAEVATEVLLLPSRAFEVILNARPTLARAVYQRLMEMIREQNKDPMLLQESEALTPRGGEPPSSEVLKSLCGILRKINFKKLQR